MISLDEALRKVLATAKVLDAERVELDEGLGRVLAADLEARWDLPVSDHSAMDGYALRTADVLDSTDAEPTELELVGHVHAGAHYDGTLRAGQTVRIMTGAPIPKGADAVIRQEAVQADGSKVRVSAPVLPGHDMRRRGEDVREGQPLLPAGTAISPQAVAVLAAFGEHQPRVVRRPRVAIIATGDELVAAADATVGSVVDSNGPMLAAMCARAGASPRRGPILADDPDIIERGLREALVDADVVISIGGASVGDRDYLRDVLGRVGFEESFWKVAIKPGKPTGFGVVGSTPFFALPGNPRAAAASFRLLVEPLLRAMQGTSGPAELEAGVSEPVDLNPARTQVLRANIRNTASGLSVALAPGQNSGRITSPLGTNGLAVLPPGDGVRRRGESVRVIPDAPIEDPAGIPVLCFVGPSNTGKTTIVSRLVKSLCRDFELGVIKHGHHFSLDREGKDSYRYRQAGARTVAVASPNDRAIMTATREPSTLAEMLRRMPPDLDAVLVEGFKQEGGAVIEVHRAGHPLLCREGKLKTVLAVVTDSPKEVPEGLPVIAHDDHERLEQFVRGYLGRSPG